MVLSVWMAHSSPPAPWLLSHPSVSVKGLFREAPHESLLPVISPSQLLVEPKPQLYHYLYGFISQFHYLSKKRKEKKKE